MTRKKMLAAAALCLALVLTAVGGTIAWLSAEAEAKNVVTIGNVTIALEEPSWKKDQVLVPGKDIPKDPRVKNTGANPCYVRAKIVLSDSDLSKSIVYQDADTTNWVKSPSSDYYYYVGKISGPTGVLPIGETTEPLFTGIRLDKKYLETGNVTEFSVDVYAEAIQSESTGIDATLTGTELANELEKLFGELESAPKN